jgi:hypothetical protein
MSRDQLCMKRSPVEGAVRTIFAPRHSSRRTDAAWQELPVACPTCERPSHVRGTWTTGGRTS